MNTTEITESVEAGIRHVTPASDPERRLFSGMYPCGIVFADRFRERHGDYLRLAFLAYSTLELEFELSCPPELRAEIAADVARMDLHPGKVLFISGNQSITLGQGRPAR